MKYFFVNVLISLFVLMHCQGETTMASLSCPNRPPNDYRGPPGIPGKPGQKGEMGESSAEIATLTAALRRGYMEIDDGWKTPFNGYQYKLIATQQNWNNSRLKCQQIGGDLASYGLRNWETRRIIFDSLNAGHGTYYWVGFHVGENEANWKWLNNTRSISTRETTYWFNTEPNGEKNEYGVINGGDLLMRSDPDYIHSHQALCQKKN